MTLSDRVRAVRRRAGLFRLSDRGLLEVGGGDRVRWLDGQLSNAVAALAPAGPRAGCYALLLTPQGRIVADVHVLARPAAFWLEAEGAALPRIRERLEKYLVADDVVLADRSAAVARLGLEGPRAPAILGAALGAALAVQPDSVVSASLAGSDLSVAAYGWSGEPAFQLFLPPGAVSAAEAALREAGAPHGLVEGDPDVLEVLRIEAGAPRFGRELGEDVLPAEARLLERAVSFQKGCYAGQEVVARMHSRGQVKHLLVGLALAPGELPPAGAPVSAGDRRVGEVTSAALSPEAGPIALGYVTRPHDVPGTALSVAGRAARVAALPFVDATPTPRAGEP